jgi:DNA-binding NtrC family response regulator
VSVVSTLGEGTTFTVLLPIAGKDASPALADPPSVGSAPATILVAEDDPAVRRVIVEALIAEGHAVVDAEDGQRALALARRHRTAFDLLCTDGLMPGITSRDLITGFRALFPGAGVLVCSGHIDESALRAGIAQQEFSFLPKPFTCEQLRAAVAASLASSRARAAGPSAPE